MGIVATAIVGLIVCTLPISLTAIIMGGIHWDKCYTVAKVQPPFSPPPGLEPQFIMTPDAAPLTNGPANNTLNRWLIIHGSLMLGLTVIQLFILIFCEAGGISIRSLFTLLMFFFQLGWVIYGGIILFNDTGKTCKKSLDRKGYKVWQTTLAMWILNLIGLPALIVTVIYVLFDD